MSKIILHCDMNNFYASVESMLHPELKGKPVAVCGDSAERHGIVLAKSYLASARGVKTAETIWSAKQKCPELIIVSPHFDEYMRVSMLAREIYGRFTSLIEPFGLDECWLDITGAAKDIEQGEVIANKIRELIKTELGVTVSVGVSFNKVFSKLGSDLKKPDAVTVIPKENFLSLIGGLPASTMIGVGGTTAEKLSTYCVETIGELAAFSKNMLIKLFGKMGEELWKSANGLGDDNVVPRKLELLDKSVGNGVTTPSDLETPDEVWRLMLELSQELGHRLSLSGKKAATVTIQIKNNELKVKQWQAPLDFPTQSPYLIATKAFELFKSSYKWDRPIRAVTVRCTNLSLEKEPLQIGIFDDKKKNSKNDLIDKTVRELRGRFGNGVIKNAVVVKKEKNNEL